MRASQPRAGSGAGTGIGFRLRFREGVWVPGSTERRFESHGMASKVVVSISAVDDPTITDVVAAVALCNRSALAEHALGHAVEDGFQGNRPGHHLTLCRGAELAMVLFPGDLRQPLANPRVVPLRTKVLSPPISRIGWCAPSRGRRSTGYRRGAAVACHGVEPRQICARCR
jgi:hypothetical protein